MDSKKVRLIRDVILLVILAAGIWFGADQLGAALDKQISHRVSIGVQTQAHITAAHEFPAARGTIPRVEVQYSYNGKTYDAPLMWSGSRADRAYHTGDTIAVYVDPHEPTKIATTSGAGSEGWLTAIPVNGSAIALAIVTAALLIRIRWYQQDPSRKRKPKQ